MYIDKVKWGDVVKLDGKIQKWADLARARDKDITRNSMEKRDFIYLKYWKPVGITCTMDKSDKTNIINHGDFKLFPQRLFTVGRLDKDSTVRFYIILQYFRSESDLTIACFTLI